MRFKIDYPSEMTAPKGLDLPKIEDIQMAVRLAGTVILHVNPVFEANDEFTITVCDEINLSKDNKLVDFRSTGEGIIIYPSANSCSMESVLGTILYCLYEQ